MKPMDHSPSMQTPLLPAWTVPSIPIPSQRETWAGGPWQGLALSQQRFHIFHANENISLYATFPPAKSQWVRGRQQCNTTASVHPHM